MGGKFAALLMFFVAGLIVVTAASIDHAALVNTSACQQQITSGMKNTKAATMTFNANVASKDTVVVMVAYANANNFGNIAISGLGATWTNGYAPLFQSGVGVAYFYGSAPSGSLATVTLTAANSDNFTVLAEDWSFLSVTEDPGSRALSTGSGTSIPISGSTSNPNDVIFHFSGFAQSASISPPSSNFLSMGVGNSGFAPFVAGAFEIASTAGPYTDTITTTAPVTWLSSGVALKSTGSNSFYSTTPLTDYQPGQLYLNKFSGSLYNGSNTPDPQHDIDGRAAAGLIEPLDSNGNPSSSGAIGVAGIGISNFTDELCGPNGPTAGCDPGSFITQAASYPGINPNMVLMDCAKGAAYAINWTTLTSTAWTACLNLMSTYYKITPAQVQVVIFEAGDQSPHAAMSSMKGSTCPSSPNPSTDPDACVYESYLAPFVRLAKSEFPNLKQIFLQTRIYAGYGSKEPYAYEMAFGSKWLIQAQINEINNVAIDPLAGDLNYEIGAWTDWGPYTWVSGNNPRLDGWTWPANNMQWDGVHPNQCRIAGIPCGSSHVADMMMSFFTSSEYTTPWFLALGATPTPTATATASATPTPTATATATASDTPTPTATATTTATPTSTPTPGGTLSFSPNPANFTTYFGAIAVGQSKSAPLTVKNSANSPPVTIQSVTTTGAFTAVNNCPASLAANTSCTVTVTFTPTTNGAQAGSIIFTDSAIGSPQTVAASGTGTGATATATDTPTPGATPMLSFSPPSINFGSVSIFTTKNQTEAATDTSADTAVTVAAATNAAPFSIVNNNCSGTLDPLAACTVTVKFTPRKFTTETNSLAFSHTAAASPQIISLSGTGKLF